MKELIRLIDLSTDSDLYTNLHHFFFTLYPGEIHYLTGLHGSGKHTLTDVLCGQLPLQSGFMYINGELIEEYNPQKARQLGIIFIDQNVSPFVYSMSVYENMEIFYAARQIKRSFQHFYNKKTAQQIQHLFSDYHLEIDPLTTVSNLPEEDIFLLSLMEAAYVNAKLVILNLSSLKLSYFNSQRVFRILRQMSENGISLLFICDSFFSTLPLAGNVSIIQKGHIIKQFDAKNADPTHINNILVPPQTLQADSKSLNGQIIGIFELYYNNYSLPEYFSNLNLHLWDNTSMCFIKADCQLSLCENLSIGDNLALVRYPSIAEKNGYIDPSVLTHLEQEFESLLHQIGSCSAQSIQDLNTVGKKILSIERWVMAGCKKLVIEDPLFGLDAKGQQIIMCYFNTLRSKDLRLIFIFYNLSAIQEICDTIHICTHGKIIRSIQELEKQEINQLELAYATMLLNNF